jgi:hypothetical protein
MTKSPGLQSSRYLCIAVALVRCVYDLRQSLVGVVRPLHCGSYRGTPCLPQLLWPGRAP